MRDTLTAIEGILAWSPSVVRDLQTAPAIQGIVEQIDVGPLIEAMVQRVGIWGRKVEVKVGISRPD
jgi:hypothetical protein